MEWLRLIKAAVSATNSQLAVGGPIRPLEGTSSGVVAVSPPSSPRGHVRAANAIADTVADAIVQLRAPDVTAQAINAWFDGLSMTDLACSALVGARFALRAYSRALLHGFSNAGSPRTHIHRHTHTHSQHIV